MGDEQALRAAVLAAPDDDLPRLVLADCYDENGQCDLGAFIRAQVELAKLPEPELKTIGPVGEEDAADQRGGRCAECLKTLPDMCAYHQLERREAELWANPAVVSGVAKGLPRLAVVYGDTSEPRFGVEPNISRGFVDSVTCSADAWVRHGDAILAAQPVRDVTLTTRPEVIVDRVTEECAIAGDLAGPVFTREAVLTASGAVGSYTPGILRLRWPRVREWHLPTERHGVGVQLPADFLTRDCTNEGLRRMEELGRQRALQQERVFIDSILRDD